MAGIGLVALSVRTGTAEPTESLAKRLDQFQQSEEIRHRSLLEAIDSIRNRPVLWIGSLGVLPPSPADRLGGVAAILDTTGAASVDSAAALSAAEIFVAVRSPNSLPMQVLAGRVRIDYLR